MKKKVKKRKKKKITWILNQNDFHNIINMKNIKLIIKKNLK